MSVRKHNLPCPHVLALFQKRMEGDDALLDLASYRFNQAGLGMEFYAETPGELKGLLKFKPHPETPAAVHLERGLDLFKGYDTKRVLDLAASAKGQIFGLVLHDQAGAAAKRRDYEKILRKMDSRLEKEDGPMLFIEYAAGLPTGEFVDLFRRIKDLGRISACVDIGHIGIRKIRDSFSRVHPGMDVCGIRAGDPEAEGLLEDIQAAVDQALPETLRVILELGAIEKHLHLHLHDGHPLSSSHPFGVSDHMSFLDMIPLPFEFRGKTSLDLMYGPAGLAAIVKESLALLPPGRLSFSLEIHPSAGRIPLDDALHLFLHWNDRRNAERMNYWLHMLMHNSKLVRDACRQAGYIPGARETTPADCQKRRRP